MDKIIEKAKVYTHNVVRYFDTYPDGIVDRFTNYDEAKKVADDMNFKTRNHLISYSARKTED